MKRRDFIKTTGAVMSAPILLNGLPVSAITNSSLVSALASSPTDRVLVFVQMQGGNDGLNMVLPIDKYNYLSATGQNGGRQEILIPDTAGLKFIRGGVDQYTNTRLHPAMGSFASQYSLDKLCVVQGAGYANQSFSHFRSTDIWMSGSDPSVIEDSGWVGRKLDNENPNYGTSLPHDPLALTIGSVSPNLFQGQNYNMGVAIQNPTSSGGISSNNVDTAPNSIYGFELDYVRTVALQTNSFYTNVQAAYNAGTNISTYPNNYFANQLKTVARLLNGGIQTKFFLVTIGGFDTHDGQVDVANHSIGQHANILGMLADGIAAFQDDISQLSDPNGSGPIEDRVIGMTFSEFGRTIKANTTSGTDHGTSAPLFLFGQDINPIVLGQNPEVYDTANAKMKSDLEVQFDFRSIYASILHQWFNIATADVNNYFGKSFNDGTNPGQNIYDGGLHCNLPILKPGGNWSPTTGVDAYVNSQRISNQYPNPVSDVLTITFVSSGEELELSVYNSLGQEVKHLSKAFYPSGDQNVSIPVNDLPKGNYAYSLSGKGKPISGRITVN